MKNLKNITIVFMVPLLLGVTGCGSSKKKSDVFSNGEVGDGRLEKVVEHYKDKYNLPAMAVLTVDNNQIIEQASVGIKKVGENEQVADNDTWSIGSITKSMTATLTAVLIDKNFLTWETTLLDVFPELEDQMHEQYKSTTMVELLSHTAGFAQDDDEVWEDYVDSDDSLPEQRYSLTQDALIYPVENISGTFLYSNVNYVVATSMLEKITGISYEELIQEYLFNPLNMPNSNVTAYNQDTNIWGHKFIGGKYKPFHPTVETTDNAKIVAPAGSRTFVTLDDMSEYLKTHLNAMQENTSFIQIENSQKLYTKVVDADEDLGYSLGWFTEGTYGVQHSGSNDRWFAISFINAQTGYAYFVVINSYKLYDSEEAAFSMIKALIERSV